RAPGRARWKARFGGPSTAPLPLALGLAAGGQVGRGEPLRRLHRDVRVLYAPPSLGDRRRARPIPGGERVVDLVEAQLQRARQRLVVAVRRFSERTEKPVTLATKRPRLSADANDGAGGVRPRLDRFAREERPPPEAPPGCDRAPSHRARRVALRRAVEENEGGAG